MIGLLEIRRRKLQFALIAMIVTLISYLVLMVNGLGVGLNQLAGSALLNLDADGIAYSDRAGLSVIRSELGQATVDAIASAPGVTRSAPMGYVAANYRRADGSVKSAAFLGFDPGTIGEPKVTAGRPLGAVDGDALLADASFLRGSGLTVGDTVEITTRLRPRSFRIVGEIAEGAFFFQPAVYVLRSTWQDLRYGSDTPDTPVASIVLVQGPVGLGKDAGRGIEIVDKDTAFANIEGVAGQQSTVQSLRGFGLIIGALIIGVFFYVLTLQKVPLIGMLKAVGASNGFVFRQVLLQVMAVASLGLAVALPLAGLTDKALQRSPDSVPIAFTTGTFVATSIALLATALLGALFSGRQITKVDTIIALGQQQ